MGSFLKFFLNASVTNILPDTQGNLYMRSTNKVIKLSSLGEVIWEYLVVGIITKISLDSQGNIYVSMNSDGRGKVIKLSPSGEVIWVYYIISDENIQIKSSDITTDSLGYSYITTSHYNIPLGGEIIKLSPYGEVVWKYGHKGYGGISISSDTQGNIFANYCNSNNSSYYGEVIALKDNYKLEKVAVLKERGGN